MDDISSSAVGSGFGLGFCLTGFTAGCPDPFLLPTPPRGLHTTVQPQINYFLLMTSTTVFILDTPP